MIYPFALLPYKIKAAMSASSISGLLGFGVVELLTNEWFMAGVTAIVASALSAGFVMIPRFMSARTEARTADADIAAKLWDQADEFKRSQIKFFEGRLAAKELIAMLERRSKHKALSECQRLVFHVNLLEGMMRVGGMNPPEFHQRTYEELVGDEDKLIEAQAILRVKEATADKLIP